MLLVLPAAAQPADLRGNTRLLPAPSFQADDLPRIAPLPPEENKLSAQLQARIKAYRFEGNTAIPTSELEKLASPYTGRTVTSEDLDELRHRITLLYIDKGYVNSGAVLPDQEIRDQIVTFRIVEGTLNAIRVTGTSALKADYVSKRLVLAPPLNVNILQQRLVLLQQNGLIERINAELIPGTRPGESALNVAVKEAIPYQMGLSLSNHYSPSVGPYHLELYASHKNLSGVGDSIEANYGLTRGINDYFLHYARPLDASDTTAGLRLSQNDTAVVEAPFNQLNITSRSQTVGIDLDRPILQTPSEKLSIGFALENRKSQTYLLNLPFSFSAGAVNGRSSESVFRFSQEWVKKEPYRAMTLRSTLSTGTTNALPKIGNIGPDKHFLSWLGQGQWAQRLDNGRQIILLANLQWSPQTLLTLEKFGLGGANTVRGYRETQLLRDSGFVFSAEYRIPILFDASGISRTQLAPFIDYGKGWNSDQSPDLPRDIASAGLGILWNPNSHWQAQAYAGYAFRQFRNPVSHDLQDIGIHFLLNYQLY